ncbi:MULTISPECIES: hypothetical protein [unclassified Achromobacter]|uniref:hypothetical protein n=1 Tax=unclassified Achromobacter TaxID=2626865 RepID=UPI000B51BD4C|nr:MULTISPECIES: hypothetical protein [unclassified Achromobacter]OWT68073.1 hypothetical protein CEY05_28995 [Achromobacter sp. HZ34]OWT69910.1 hypothetical protein CEY04_27825 [Achromobacter sp. HZ28]
MSKATDRRILILLTERDELMQSHMMNLIDDPYHAVVKALTRLHKAKQIHISGWEKNHAGHYAAVWAIGEFYDAPMPKGDQCRGDFIGTVVGAIASLELTPFRTAMWNVERGQA